MTNNDLPDTAIDCTMNLYADDITIHSANTTRSGVSHSLSADLARIADQTQANKLKMNVNKTQLMTLGSKTSSRITQQIEVHQKGLVLQYQLHNRVENLADVSTRCSGLLLGEAEHLVEMSARFSTLL